MLIIGGYIILNDSIWNKNFLYLCGSNFLIGLMFYMLATTLPLYVQVGLNGDEKQMGLIISVYVLGSVFARIFSGALVDRYGQKKMGMIGFSIFFIMCIVYFGVKNGLVLFLIIRFIHGMSYAIASTVTNTAVISILPAKRRGEGIGYFSMFISLAMVVGPSFGLFLWKDENIYIVLIAVAILSAIALLLMKLIELPKLDEPTTPTKFEFKNIIEKKAIPISLVSFCLFFSYSSLSGFLASYTKEINLAKVASIFFVLYAIMIVAFRPFMSRLFDKFPVHYFFYPSMLLFGIGMLLLSQANSNFEVLSAGVIMGFSYGILTPCLQNTVVNQVPINRSGAATSTFFLLADLGYGLGTYILGALASYSDYRVMYVSSAIVAFIAMVIYFAFYHRNVRKNNMNINDKLVGNQQ